VHPISFAPSLTVYRHLVHRAALAAADTAPAPLDESLVVGGAIPSPSYELPDLPGALVEATKVATLLGMAPDTALTGEEATGYAVGLALGGRRRLVHIASHARPRVLALTPMVGEASKTMANAALEAQQVAREMMMAVERGELSADSEEVKGQLEEAEQIMAEAAPATALVERAQQLGPLGDGLIVVDALADRPLKGFPTVVLAGSHSGYGSISHDGALGLPRALLCAGARAVVGAMHEVADAPATTLFAAFYEALTKPGPPISQAEALRQAMLATRQADGGKWAHPAFWAGFALIGAAKGL